MAKLKLREIRTTRRKPTVPRRKIRAAIRKTMAERAKAEREASKQK